MKKSFFQKLLTLDFDLGLALLSSNQSFNVSLVRSNQ
jgi:hypothetical protein